MPVVPWQVAQQASASRTLKRLQAIVDADEDAAPLDFNAWSSQPELSLLQFLTEAWDVLEPAVPLHTGWHVKAMCEHAQALVLGDFRRLLVNVPPGTTKSTIYSVALQCWTWTFRPSFRWMCASYDQDTANDLASKRRQLLVSEWYRNRWPVAATLTGTGTRKARDTIKLIQNIAGGEMLATSPSGRLLGKHFHGGVCDDLHNPKAAEALTEKSLKEVENWLRNVVSTRGAAKDIRAVLAMIMQRLDEKDASAVMLELWPDTEHLCLPMKYDPDHPVRDPKSPTALGFVDPRTEKGELLCSERFGPEEVAALESALRPHGAAGQLQQQPSAPAGDRFRREWFKVLPAEQIPQKIYTQGRAVRYWDKAGTEGAGDWTVGCLVVQFEGKFYVMDVVRGQWGAANRKLVMRQTAERDDATWQSVIQWQEQEPGSGGKESAELTAKDLEDHIVRTDRVTDPKKVRYDGWEEELDCTTNPKIPTVYLAEGAWNRAFVDEHCAWRWEDKNPTDDQIDATSGAYTKLRKRRKFAVA